MKYIHGPLVNARYWAAILMASVFGTNLGDYYAHESGLGIGAGVAVLALLAAGVFAVERFDHRKTEIYYWLVILLIRTGATNIADFLAFRVRIPPLLLVSGLIALLCLFGWGTRRALQKDEAAPETLPNTNAPYWLAMLTAGVFGTVVGDICSHAVGEGVASIGLLVLFLAVLLAGRGRAAQIIALYWTTIAVARTAGTAIGDWLAENHYLNIGLGRSTLMTGIVFAGVLILWRTRSKTA